jgi:flagellar hook protein FlgE
MQTSLYTAVSGVKSHQTYLDVTGHNISNVNTVGYKRDVRQFADMIRPLIRSEAAPVSPPGGVNPAQVGLGVKVASISPCFAQGSLQATEMPTDMAIQGDGFFIVNNRGQQLYTRAGNFALDREGNLVMQGNGYLVQGYKFNGTQMEDALSGIVIPVGEEMPQNATAIAAFRCNLDSRNEARIPDLGNIPAGEDMVARPFVYSGAADVSASASSSSNQAAMDAFGDSMRESSDWKDSFVVYDEAGDPHTMNVVFRKVFDRPADTASTPPVPAESEWDWYAYYTDANGEVQPQYGQGGGTMVFGDGGTLKRTYTFDPAANWGVVEKNISGDSDDGKPTGLVGADFVSPGAPIKLDFLGSDYAASQGLPFNGAIDAVTNFGSYSTTKVKGQDGYARGSLQNWSVSDYGLITGEYSNSQTRPIAQVALARFINPQGLTQMGTTCFAESPDSGAARIMTPGEGGAGYVKGLTVEMSNVELSEEFVNLIKSQRGLQGNTRVVTTSDQMLETAINLKR